MRFFNNLSNMTLVVIFNFLINISVFAQVQSVETDADLKTKSDDKTEIISVSGQKPLGLYREEMVEFRLEFFEMLNALNDKPEFKIKCEKKSTIESRIKKTICEPQYLIDMRAKLNQKKSKSADLLGSASTQISDKELNVRLKDWHEKADQEKLRLITSNPNLKEQFLKLIKSENNYKRLHVEAYGSLSNYYDEITADEKNHKN